MVSEQQKRVFEKVQTLSGEYLEEALNFIEFLQQKALHRTWIEFDEWALNLAKSKGFNHLTEDDVSALVKAHRKSTS